MTNPNIPGTNPNQQPMPDQLQALITANELTDTVRNVFSYAETDAEKDSLFDPNGFDGINDLLLIATDIRNDARVLDSRESLFASYMNAQSRNYAAAARIDMSVLEQPITTSNGATLTDDDAVSTNLSNAVGTIKQKVNATTDPAEVTRLEAQSDAIEAFNVLFKNSDDITPGTTNEDGIKLGHAYMEAVRSLRAATTDPEHDAAQATIDDLESKMGQRSDQFKLQADAYEAVHEHGRTEFRSTNTPLATIDPRLGYVAAPGAPIPTAGTPPPAGNGGGNPPNPPAQPPTPPAGGNGGNQPPANGGNGGNNQPPAGGNYNAQYELIRKAALDQARDDQAEQKSRYIRNSKIGRAVIGIVAPGYETRRQATEDIYQQLVKEDYDRKNNAFITDANVSADDKANHMALSIQAEQGQLRDIMTKNMKDFRMAKLGRFVLRHKKAVIIGATLLAPFTGIAGAATGLGMGIGTVVTAYHDKLKREQGVKAIDSTAKKKELYATIVANGIQSSFMHAMELADRHTDIETTDVMMRRRNSLAIGFAALMGTHVAAAYMPGPFHVADKSLGWMGRGAGNLASAMPYPSKPF